MIELTPPLEIVALFSPFELGVFFIIFWTALGFTLSRLLKRNDVADLLWGSGIAVLVTAMGFLGGDGPLGPTQWLILALVTLWGARLTLFLAIRNLPEPEDSRYAAWRTEWGAKEPVVALFRVFFLQAVIATFVSTAAWGGLLERSEPHPLTPFTLFLGFIALSGLLIESVADLQLLRFKRRPTAGKAAVLNSGLWRYSRHPNYFGESLFWVTLTGLSLGSTSSWAWMGAEILGSAVMTFLLLKVSGVAMTERGMKSRRKGGEYDHYVRTTSPFIPLPPRLYQKLNP